MTPFEKHTYDVRISEAGGGGVFFLWMDAIVVGLE